MLVLFFFFLFKDAGVKKSGVKLDLKFRAYVGKSLKSNFVIIFLHLLHVLEWIIFFFVVQMTYFMQQQVYHHKFNGVYTVKNLG